jgi:hypothetical protein
LFQPIRELAGVVTRIYAHDTGLASPADEPSWLIAPAGEIKVIASPCCSSASGAG